MKTTGKLTIFVLAFLTLAASAYALSPREQLKQMVEQLRANPTDNALREKIIKLAPTLKPSPALPDTAIEFEGRAQFAFRSAKSEGDFLAAAQEYEKAVAAAPWVLGYYSDLCTIYEKANKYEDAKRHCGLYLTGLTDPAQMTELKRRIAGLEFGIEKAQKETAAEEEAKKETAAEEAKYGGMLGEWSWVYSHRGHSWDAVTWVAKKSGDGVEFSPAGYPNNRSLRATFDTTGETVWYIFESARADANCPGQTGWVRLSMTVSSDRRRLNYQRPSYMEGQCNPMPSPNEFELRKR